MESQYRHGLRVLRLVHEFHVAYADGLDDPDPRFLPLLNTRSTLLMPPSGDAEDIANDQKENV